MMTALSVEAVPEGVSFRSILPVSDGLILLRPLGDADVDWYVRGTWDPLVRRFAHLPPERYTPGRMRELIATDLETGLETGTLAVLAIADRQSDRFLGSLVLFDIQPDLAEVGYWLLPDARGQGVLRRALALARQIGMTMGWRYLRARTEANNLPSLRGLEAAGFKPWDAVAGQAQAVPSGQLVPVRTLWARLDG